MYVAIKHVDAFDRIASKFACCLSLKSLGGHINFISSCVRDQIGMTYLKNVLYTIVQHSVESKDYT